MANSFPPPISYHAPYAQPAFYPPPYNQNGNPGHPYSPALQHNPPFPPMIANAQRFDANSNVPSPPPPLPAPAHMPKDWNPDMLRQLAASGSLRFPFPPPPPPPPPQLFSSSFNSNHQAPTVTAHPQQQPAPPFQSPASPFHGSTGFTTQPPSFSANTDTQIIAFEQGMSQGAVSALRPPSATGTRMALSAAHALEGASVSHSQNTPTSHILDSHSNQVASSTTISQIPHKANDSSSTKNLHLKAKAAIAQCIAFGATQQFWLDNGVDSSVVDKIFSELNFLRPDLSTTSLTKTTQATEPHVAVPLANSNVPPPRQDAAQRPRTPQIDLVDPALERKDRIARLLAAKKGQSLASAKSSQSGSPAPTDRLLQSESIRSKPSHLQDEPKLSEPEPVQAAEHVKIKETLHPSSLSFISPKPAPDQLQHSRFSIPGLFMTSAEEAEITPASNSTADLVDVVLPAVVEAPGSPNHLKRVADPLPNSRLPDQKRQASEAVVLTENRKTPTPDLAVLAAVSQPGPFSDALTEIQESAPAHGTEKLNDSHSLAPRSRINQDKLKDRMAALKADLLRKNSRKVTLQDGMPMLDAEVERTRDHIQEQQKRLSIVKKNIEVRTMELVRDRDEEARLLQEIQRLELHLADGMKGQQRFSTELTQLNNQIGDNEKESKDTQHPSTSTSSMSFESSKPVIKLDPSIVGGSLRLSSLVNGDRSRSARSSPIDEQPAATSSHIRDENGRSENEYSPEQEDLDRQLNFEVVPNANQQQEASEAVGEGGMDVPSPAVLGLSREPSLEADITMQDEQEAIDSSDDDHMSIDEASDAGSSGSASMSDSGSEDYEPALNQYDAEPEPIEENEDYEPADTISYRYSLDAENDDYEPTEEVPVIDIDIRDEHQTHTDGSGTSRASSRSVESPAASPILNQEDPSPDDATSTNEVSVVEITPTATDYELTLQETPVMTESFQVLVPLSESEKPAVSRFMPYQSPLSTLKSFRFHPQFSDIVKNGYRSLTYSNNIDAKTPICSVELEGGLCSDVKCTDQHFGAMALSDDKILVQMSSANDLKDKDQRDAYLLGLKKVIADLRGRGVREFSEVANALSKYRREWLQTRDGF